ncbi:MAG TPA: hypothetical protein VIX63_17535 [Vicinamibacterales bacterium]
MRSSAVVIFALALAASIPGGADHALAGGAPRQGTPGAHLEEYADLLVTIGEQALRTPRLASPLPCLAHWLAGSDHVVVGVSRAGAAAGLERSDTLRRLGGRDLTGRGEGLWDTAMRALPRGQPSYAVEVDRKGRRLRLVLPCEADGARTLQQAEQAMWTAVTQRDWTACLMRGAEMIAAFGAGISPPLMVMTQCATASGMPEARLTDALARALLAEMVAHPGPQPDLREQLFLAVRQLDAMHAAGGADYATNLRAEMARLGVDPEVR